MSPPRAYRALLFDLFGTIVFFRTRPIAQAGGMTGAQRFLAELVRTDLSHVDAGAFLEAVRTVSAAMQEERLATHREFSSPERFRRVLEHLGRDDRDHLSVRLAEAHMRGLAEAAELPAGHMEIVAELASRFRVGLVSNFDYAPTARAILERLGLTRLLDPIVISDEFGWRKPHRDIFRHAVDRIGVPGEDILFIGDTPLDDIHGARGAGLDAAWLNWDGREYPAAMLAPTLTAESLQALARRLTGIA